MTDLGDKILGLRNKAFQLAKGDRDLGDVLTKTMDLIAVLESRAFDNAEEVHDSINLLKASIERHKPRDSNRHDPLRDIIYNMGEIMGPLVRGLMYKLNGDSSTGRAMNSAYASTSVFRPLAPHVSASCPQTTPSTDSGPPSGLLFGRVKEEGETGDLGEFPLWDTTDTKEGILDELNHLGTNGQTRIQSGGETGGIRGETIRSLLGDGQQRDQRDDLSSDSVIEDDGQPSTSKGLSKRNRTKTKAFGEEEEVGWQRISSTPLVGTPSEYTPGKDGKFKCPRCSRKFNSPKGVASHFYVHESVKCNVLGCGQNVKRHNFSTHSWELHGIEVPRPPRTNKTQFPMECPEASCRKTLHNKGHLKYHNDMHAGVKPYSCEYCPSTFCSISTRFNHIKKVHGELPYPCNQCDQKFGLKAELDTHRQEVHAL